MIGFVLVSTFARIWSLSAEWLITPVKSVELSQIVHVSKKPVAIRLACVCGIRRRKGETVWRNE
jgi:hypothetical protein